jgi:hypothetical protein
MEKEGIDLSQAMQNVDKTLENTVKEAIIVDSNDHAAHKINTSRLVLAHSDSAAREIEMSLRQFKMRRVHLQERAQLLIKEITDCDKTIAALDLCLEGLVK